MKSQTLDLTHPIHQEMLLYPGTPAVNLKKFNTIETNGFNETQIKFTSHVGTHIDAPAHLIKNGKLLTEFPAETFWGEAIFVDCKNCGPEISISLLKENLKKKEIPDFVILRTGNCEKWPNESYLKDYPVLSFEAAKWLVNQGIKAVGIDAVSVDPLDSEKLPVHHIFLENNVLIIENIKIPEALSGKRTDLVVAPLNFVEADGAPVRIFARI